MPDGMTRTASASSPTTCASDQRRGIETVGPKPDNCKCKNERTRGHRPISGAEEDELVGAGDQTSLVPSPAHPIMGRKHKMHSDEGGNSRWEEHTGKTFRQPN